MTAARARVLVVALGGTIAMAGQAGGGLRPALDGDALVGALPGWDERADVSVESFRSVPGVHLTLGDVVELATFIRTRVAAEALDGVVVTSGTDTLEEVAFALHLLGCDVPVVLTGAMRPMGAPGSDGPANLDAALRVAASPGAAARGALVVLGDLVHAAVRVHKAHTTAPDAFRSAHGGPVGLVHEGGVTWHSPAPSGYETVEFPVGAVLPPVPLVTTMLGDDGSVLRAVAASHPAGVVLEATGAGHVPPPLLPALGELAAAVPVVLTSRVGDGPVLRDTYGFEGSEASVLRRGVLWGGALSGRKAAILVALALSAGWSRTRLRSALDRGAWG